MNSDSGYVFHIHESKIYGAFTVWKQKNSGNSYVFIRGTTILRNIITDLDVT